MSKIKKWFQPRYKIVPTYTADNKVNGYMPLKHSCLDYMQMPMLQIGADGNFHQTNAWFKTYDDAMEFLKHEVKVFDDEEISHTEND